MSATRKPEMSRAQKAIERVHHKLMDMRDATPMRDGSIEAEENYLKVYKKAYRESQSSTYFAAAERYRLFLQGKPVPGAPLQPWATQPEPDGVAHETEPHCENENCGHPYWEHFHDAEGATCDVTGCHCLNYTGAEPEPVFTHSELTTLLERMARLVVEEAGNAAHDMLDDCDDCLTAKIIMDRIYALLTIEKLQQLREAVERT